MAKKKITPAMLNQLVSELTQAGYDQAEIDAAKEVFLAHSLDLDGEQRLKLELAQLDGDIQADVENFVNFYNGLSATVQKRGNKALNNMSAAQWENLINSED